MDTKRPLGTRPARMVAWPTACGTEIVCDTACRTSRTCRYTTIPRVMRMTRWTSFWTGVRILRKPFASARILFAKLASPTAVTSYQPEPDMQKEPDDTFSPADLWIASDSPVSCD